MGLLSAAMNPQVLPQPMGGGRPPITPQMPPQGQGMAGAWANNPQLRPAGSGATSDYEQRMGLLSAAMNQQVLPQPMGGGRPPITPQMPPQSDGMLGAFANNPQFQSYLQSLMQGQGPGMQMPQMMAPQMRMQTMPMQQSRGAFGAGGY